MFEAYETYKAKQGNKIKKEQLRTEVEILDAQIQEIENQDDAKINVVYLSILFDANNSDKSGRGSLNEQDRSLILEIFDRHKTQAQHKIFAFLLANDKDLEQKWHSLCTRIGTDSDQIELADYVKLLTWTLKYMKAFKTVNQSKNGTARHSKVGSEKVFQIEPPCLQGVYKTYSEISVLELKRIEKLLKQSRPVESYDSQVLVDSFGGHSIFKREFCSIEMNELIYSNLEALKTSGQTDFDVETYLRNIARLLQQKSMQKEFVGNEEDLEDPEFKRKL